MTDLSGFVSILLSGRVYFLFYVSRALSSVALNILNVWLLLVDWLNLGPNLAIEGLNYTWKFTRIIILE